MNYQTHGCYDVFGPYTTVTDTFDKNKANRDVNLRRKKYGNCESRGPGSDRQSHIQDQITNYEAGVAKVREKLVSEPRREKCSCN